MNLSHLYYFRKLAEVQHYTHAAEQLFITQPTLSNAISQLEKELGIFLFERDGRNVKLTKQGREFNQYISQALDLIDKGVDIAHEYSGSMSASFDVGAVYTIQADYLPAVMTSFRLKYGPDIKININQGLTDHLLEDLRNGRYDLVFCAKRADLPNVEYFEVAGHRLVALLHDYNPHSNDKSVSLDDLMHSRVITYTPGTVLGDEVNELLKPYIDRGMMISGTCDDEITMGSMVASDPSAVGIVLDTLGLLPFKNLKTLALSECPGSFHPVYLAYRKNVFQPRSVENFIKFVKEYDYKPVGQTFVLPRPEASTNQAEESDD